MKQTKTERIIAFLLASGSKELRATGSKYRKFSSPTATDRFYFVGKSGACRSGKIPLHLFPSLIQ